MTRRFEFHPSVQDDAAAVLSGTPDELVRRMLRDQESEWTFLAARRILHAFLGPIPSESESESESDDPAELFDRTATVRTRIREAVEDLSRCAPHVRHTVLRQRAPIALIGGCWLDTVSQPATQPGVVVNRLFEHHFRQQGDGNPQRSLQYLRRRALESHGVHLPDLGSADFLDVAGARPLTALHMAFRIALSRLPASFLPEVVGLHYAVTTLGVDDLLLGSAPLITESQLRGVVAGYLESTTGSVQGPVLRRRLRLAVELGLTLEQEHVAMLAELASWQEGLPLDAQVAAIVQRHAKFAGRQHRDVRIGKELLSQTLSASDFDVAAFVRDLRASRHVRRGSDGDARFLRAIRFGGPMFGIFDEREAAVFTAWVRAADAGELPGEVEVPVNRAGDDAAARRISALVSAEPVDLEFCEPGPLDDRQLFHRLVNIERYPSVLSDARVRAAAGLDAGEILFRHGSAGRYTDATWFEYSPEALVQRVEQIYWQKLVDPYRPLTEIPDRDDVVFGQKTFALGSLIDGAWAHRAGNLGRFSTPADGMLFSIYADEMGRGDLRKNHITLIHQVLRSMSIEVPHIADESFLEQDELPDNLYGFSIHQLCLALFPDSHHPEILGYNLGIEMFGLGEMRMHEMQKLRHHGFDVAYEEAHLSIDNMSAGHARQSADIVVGHLDGLRRITGDAVVQHEWRRIWRGYASFAYFVEHALVRELADRQADTSAELIL